MRVIDAHTHIFPKKIEKKATEAIRAFYDVPAMRHLGSPEELLLSGKKAGVERFLVFSTATSPHQVVPINDFIISECRKHPEFIGVGTMHAEFAGYGQEIERIGAQGVRGIKLHPDFQRFDIDDRRLFPLYDLMEQKGMFLITHAGDHRTSFSHPVKIARVAREFKRLRVIAAHFGGWMMWELAREVLRLPNVFVDTSSTAGFAGAGPVAEGVRAFGRGRVFFGSDFPMWDPGTEIRRIEECNLGEDVLEDVFYNNFAEFYGLGG